MRFSQRIGLNPATKLAQRESIDEELRSSLWSILTLVYWNSYEEPNRYSHGRSDYVSGSNISPLITSLWLHYFKKPIDTIDTYWEYCYKKLREYFFSATWYEVYDFVEFIARYGEERKKEKFIELCNSYLERENSAYRFLNGQITEITSQEEIDEVETALSNASSYAGVRTHLESALALLSDRKNPDYRNSIKESISAVESLAKKLSGSDNGTLGTVLKALEKSKKLHPALKNAFSSLYGYTNDADGIRHALLEEANLTKADARFMLICCSAFINFALEAIGA
ncbi:MAG: AbiJ-NTD4 domain-containing protein [Gammaproteobacteria bacterium]